MAKGKRCKYNNGGEARLYKSIGDLDMSLGGSGAGSKKNWNADVNATASKGPWTVSNQSGMARFKNQYDKGKVKWSDSQLSYTHTTKGGAKVTGSVGSGKAGLSIFKALK